MRRSIPASLTWLPLAALVATTACQRGLSEQVQAQLSALDTIAAQRDSLFTEVADNARLLNEIGAELEKVEGLTAPDPASAESPMGAQREELLHKVRQVTAKLGDAEQRLATNRTQLRRANRSADTLKQRVTELEQMVAGFEQMIESQRTTITTLTERVTALEAETVALRDTMATMDERQNTAYYVVGTRDELIERGIIVKEGGARVLFIFGKSGQTLRPARELDPSQFTPIDIREVTEIPLPDSTAEYVIASRQNLEYLATPPEEKGHVRGAIRIGAPEQFWLPSKFLILVRG